MFSKKVSNHFLKQLYSNFFNLSVINLNIIYFFILINICTSTYTDSLIDHKTLLSPKQLISKTFNKIQPKYISKINDDKNYDEMNSDLNDNNEQITQNTYYFTDYKPTIKKKKIVPTQLNCFDTGKTVCNNANSYPAESILKLIREASSNKFNFSSLFFDESENDSQPNLQELDIDDRPCSPEIQTTDRYIYDRKRPKINKDYNRKNSYLKKKIDSTSTNNNFNYKSPINYLNSLKEDKQVKKNDYNYDQQKTFYRNSNTKYKNENKQYKTTLVTIVPFIQYITQLPSNNYQITSDKQLLNTINKSLQQTTLNNYSPDAWLPIKAFTADIDQKELTDQFSNDEIIIDSNYRIKRSTCKEKKNSYETRRVKKQIDLSDEPEELCKTRKLFITPKAALNDKSEWRYIVNLGEKDKTFKQIIKVDICASPNQACSSQISLPFGYISKCKQKYIKKKLLALNPDGQSTSTENFFIPSCCVCEISKSK